jgi:alpha-mannosidase
MDNIVIHLIPNAHLDPVWMWDWREGFTEMITTTRTVLDLMDEYPELTFVRGEAFLYQQIEKHAPETFGRIRRFVESGRWEVVGGTMLQSDMNLPATETLMRHLLYAQRYFQERFGVQARAGWSADCFGHSAALPDILAAAGLEYYAYTRPAQVPPQNTFWWQGPGGARLLAHHPPIGWYGTERGEMRSRLDGLLELAQQGELHPIACFMGLGNHGGHPTRRQIGEALSWAADHPEVKLQFSTLTRFFDAVRVEVSQSETFLPVYEGELNFTTRGVYAATARFKYPYRKTEALLSRAERVGAIVAAATGTKSDNLPHALNADLHPAWEAVLFNTFHDILPGSSGERMYDEQLDWLGTAAHAARLVEQQAILQLAARVETRVRPAPADFPTAVPLLVFNPHPWPYQGLVELDACLDYRPIWKYREHPQELPMTVRDPQAGLLAHQRVDGAYLYSPTLNLRNQALAKVEIPPFGWKVLEFAYEEGAPETPVTDPTSASAAAEGGAASIRNGVWEVQAAVGDPGIHIFRAGKALLVEPGLWAATVEDPWGAWGDFNESPESVNLTEVRCTWKVTRVEVGERGPLRSTLHVRLEGGQSRMDLTFGLDWQRDALDISARVLWDERCARLKLCLPGGFQTAEYDVLGGSITRGALGEVPGGRWVRLKREERELGFASDALYGFNLTPEGSLQASIARATRYSADGPANVDEYPWQPVLDTGELRFRCLITTGMAHLAQMAAELEQPPLVAHVTPSAGDWEKTGSLLRLEPESLRVLAIKPAEEGEGWVLRVQSSAEEAVRPKLNWLGQEMELAPVPPMKIATYRISREDGKRWVAQEVSVLEV